jgi:hypothetical protein
MSCSSTEEYSDETDITSDETDDSDCHSRGQSDSDGEEALNSSHNDDFVYFPRIRRKLRPSL